MLLQFVKIKVKSDSSLFSSQLITLLWEHSHFVSKPYFSQWVQNAVWVGGFLKYFSQFWFYCKFTKNAHVDISPPFLNPLFFNYLKLTVFFFNAILNSIVVAQIVITSSKISFIVQYSQKFKHNFWTQSRIISTPTITPPSTLSLNVSNHVIVQQPLRMRM